MRLPTLSKQSCHAGRRMAKACSFPPGVRLLSSNISIKTLRIQWSNQGGRTTALHLTFISLVVVKLSSMPVCSELTFDWSSPQAPEDHCSLVWTVCYYSTTVLQCYSTTISIASIHTTQSGAYTIQRTLSGTTSDCL